MLTITYVTKYPGPKFPFRTTIRHILCGARGRPRRRKRLTVSVYMVARPARAANCVKYGFSRAGSSRRKNRSRTPSARRPVPLDKGDSGSSSPPYQGGAGGGSGRPWEAEPPRPGGRSPLIRGTAEWAPGEVSVRRTEPPSPEREGARGRGGSTQSAKKEPHLSVRLQMRRAEVGRDLESALRPAWARRYWKGAFCTSE